MVRLYIFETEMNLRREREREKKYNEELKGISNIQVRNEIEIEIEL